MLKGTRDGILKRIQPVSIHGQISWDLFFAAGGFAAAVCLLQRRLGAMVVTSLFMGFLTFAAVVRAFASLDHGLHEALAKGLGFVAGVAVGILLQKYISPLARTDSTRQP